MNTVVFVLFCFLFVYLFLRFLDNSSCVFESRARIDNIDKNVYTTTQLRKGERYLLTTNVNSSCSQLTFEWKVAKVTTLPLAVETAYFRSVASGSEWSDSSSLYPGKYLVEFVGHFENFYFLDYGFIEVLPSPPVPLIVGASEVSRQQGAVLTFDASPSYDADLGPGINEGLTFSWTCSSTSGGGCFGSAEQNFIDNGRIMSVNTTTMQAHQFYDVQLKVSAKNGLNSSFMQRVHLVSFSPLHVEIK